MPQNAEKGKVYSISMEDSIQLFIYITKNVEHQGEMHLK